VTLLKKIDQVMLGTMDSKYAVGIYSASVRLSDCWSFLPVAVVTSIFPLLVGLRETDKLRYSEAVQKLHDALVWLAIVAALLVAFLGRDIVHFIFGGDYDDSVRVLHIHIWSAVFAFTGIIRAKWLVIEGLTKYSFITTLLGAICNIGLNIFLIPLYGPVGAAVATLISRVFMSYLLCLFLRPMWPCFVFFNKALLAPGRYIVKWLAQ
jgi:O-antigen/teichoic acid export membrane protein